MAEARTHRSAAGARCVAPWKQFRPSVRAGTDQATVSEGAPDHGAARRAKCQVGTHARAWRETTCSGPGAARITGSAGRKQIRQRQTNGTGSGARVKVSALRRASPSRTPHASVMHPCCGVQQAVSAWSSCSGQRSAASSWQCSVTGSQSASNSSETSFTQRCTGEQSPGGSTCQAPEVSVTQIYADQSRSGFPT